MNKLDLHIHSIASGHAFNTVHEIITYSQKMKMEMIALTDHGPSMKRAPHAEYFEMLNRIPRKVGQLEILSGCEANIIDLKGSLDIPKEILKKLDLVIAGIHKLTPYPKSTTINENTNSIINAIRNNELDIISHPWRLEFPINLKQVVIEAGKYNVILEINISLLKIYKNNQKVVNKIQEMIHECAIHEVMIVVSSDAHWIYEIGDVAILKELNIKIPKKILVNLKYMKKRLNERRKK